MELRAEKQDDGMGVQGPGRGKGEPGAAEC